MTIIRNAVELGSLNKGGDTSSRRSFYKGDTTLLDLETPVSRRNSVQGSERDCNRALINGSWYVVSPLRSLDAL